MANLIVSSSWPSEPGRKNATAHRPGWASIVGRIGRRVRLLALGLMLALPVVAAAQPAPGIDPAALIEEARKDMVGVRAAQSDESDDATSLRARRLALTVQTRAEEAAAALSTELTDVQARLTELGEPAAGVKEPADIASQRAQLVKTQTALDAQVKLAKLLSVEAGQAAESLGEQRRSRFNAQLFERTPAIASATFWQELRSELPGDGRRLTQILGELQARSVAISPGVWLVAAMLVLAIVLARTPVERLLRQLILQRTPGGRLRRSLHAASVTLVWTLTLGLAAHVIFLALTAGGGVSSELRALLAGFDGIVWFGGFCVGLGLALLMPGRPSWRLPPMSDMTANKLRWLPPALVFAIVLGWVSTRLSAAADVSLATTVGLKSLASLTTLLLLMGALAQLRRSRRAQQAAARAAEAAHAAPAGMPLWLLSLTSLASVLLVFTLLGLLSGYVALGTFVINQMVWGLTLWCLAYLLVIVVDDLFMAFLAPTAPAADSPDKTASKSDTAHRPWEQVAVLLSGAFRVTLIIFALVLALAPFGEGPLELFQRAGRVNEGLAIGEIRVLPATLLQGLLVLVIGLFVVRMLKSWLGQKLMPTTRFDAGMRTSITTLFGYVGAIGVIALAMSAVGVGLERVAWVASALSVGIGFGLQAVVQNFVSGLILLAERPVKVGDWVSLAGVEGDIRRINVRATEIQMSDRSTVIVPNSEFITKIVRNVTFTDPIGMVQIKLPMPLSTDTRQARAVLLDAFLAHPGVLASPKPNVQLDGIDGHHLVFNATGFVSSPRAVYGVKSDLLFEVMDRLRAAGIDLVRPPTMVLSPASALPPETADIGPAGAPKPAAPSDGP